MFRLPSDPFHKGCPSADNDKPSWSHINAYSYQDIMPPGTPLRAEPFLPVHGTEAEDPFQVPSQEMLRFFQPGVPCRPQVHQV